MNNTMKNVMAVNNQKVVIENNARNASFHMTMEDLRVFQPEKYDIISQYLRIHTGMVIEKGYVKTSIPVVDVTAGKIYPSLALGKSCANFSDYTYTRYKVSKHLEEKKIVKGYKPLFDYESNDLTNHYLMYAEDVPTAILKEYLRIEKIKIEEESNAKRLERGDK